MSNFQESRARRDRASPHRLARRPLHATPGPVIESIEREDTRQKKVRAELVGTLNILHNEIASIKRQLSDLVVVAQPKEKYEYFVLDGSTLPAMKTIETRINEMASNGWRLIFCGGGRWYFFERVVLSNPPKQQEHNW